MYYLQGRFSKAKNTYTKVLKAIYQTRAAREKKIHTTPNSNTTSSNSTYSSTNITTSVAYLESLSTARLAGIYRQQRQYGMAKDIYLKYLKGFFNDTNNNTNSDISSNNAHIKDNTAKLSSVNVRDIDYLGTQVGGGTDNTRAHAVNVCASVWYGLGVCALNCKDYKDAEMCLAVSFFVKLCVCVCVL